MSFFRWDPLLFQPWMDRWICPTSSTFQYFEHQPQQFSSYIIPLVNRSRCHSNLGRMSPQTSQQLHPHRKVIWRTKNTKNSFKKSYSYCVSGQELMTIATDAFLLFHVQATCWHWKFELWRHAMSKQSKLGKLVQIKVDLPVVTNWY